MYQRLKLPLMSERELIMQFTTKECTGEHAGKTLWIMQTVQSNKYPLREKCIRMYVQKYFLMWDEGDDVVG